jgi:hypothetical protein
MTYEIKIGIQAHSEKQARDIVEDLITIKNNLSDQDLKDLATLLKKNPEIVKAAKKWL